MILSNFAQEQTKEETIAWLKEKLKSLVELKYPGVGLSVNTLSLKTIDECSITFTYNYNYVDGTVVHEVTLPAKDVSIHKDRLYCSYSAISNKDTGNREISLSLYSPFYIVETEAKLKERLLKVLNHLATFCV